MSEPEGQDEPQGECMACHGSGKIISNLGGVRSTITCPWCRGSGTRIPGADAQEYRRTLTGTPHGGAHPEGHKQAGEQHGDEGGGGEAA